LPRGLTLVARAPRGWLDIALGIVERVEGILLKEGRARSVDIICIQVGVEMNVEISGKDGGREGGREAGREGGRQGGYLTVFLPWRIFG
jgi:hypothetical protein